jgi:hypothetical protein
MNAVRGAGAVILGLLTLGTALIAFVSSGEALRGSDDWIAGAPPPVFALWAIAATGLLVFGIRRWRAGRPWPGVGAAWVAVPLWMMGFGAVYLAALATGILTLLAWLVARGASRSAGVVSRR